MSRATRKEFIRTVGHSFGRFFAIALISFLGAGVFAGLRMSAPDLRACADEYFDATNLYDVMVVSPGGFDDASCAAIAAVPGVEAVMPSYSVDAMLSCEGESFAANVQSLPAAAATSDTSDGAHAYADDASYLNRPLLLEGSWPKAPDECVVGLSQAYSLGLALGDELHLGRMQGNAAGIFTVASFKVTGFVLSSAFCSDVQLGTTHLGSGTIDAYVYVSGAAFNSALPYTTIYATIAQARAACWGTASYDDAVAPAVARIEEAAAEIGSNRSAEVFVADRTKNAGAAAREHDAQSIQQIATYLPYVFILVAVLVVLASMTRMVDEERMVIGTHKALGYSNRRIAARYLAYGTLASGIGSLAGVLVGAKLLPWFILSSYAINYSIPFMSLEICPDIAAIAVGITVGVAFVATWIAVSASLHERPAALMLPRVPKAGKRILLEHIGFLWRHLSFSHKVTARNLLRYKPRFFMAVVGVAGCTALLVVGFGMRDVIGGIVSSQYDELVTYDALVTMVEGENAGAQESGTPAGTAGAAGAAGTAGAAAGTANTAGAPPDASVSPDTSAPIVNSVEAERAALRHALSETRIARLFSQPGIASYQFVHEAMMIASGRADNADLRVEVIVPSNVDEFDNYITLRDRSTHEVITLNNNSLVLSEKAATELGVEPGDTIRLYNENLIADKSGEAYEFLVGAITENYLQHYIYMTPALYQAVIGTPPSYAAVLLNFASGADVDGIVDTLLANSAVSSVTLMADHIDNYVEMLDIMNKLIVVILFLAAALAFVVLYNLTNININERVREIATLKVLGFTRHEVNLYIFREIFIMVLIGAVVGCVIGAPLTLGIARAAETADMMFGREIAPTSFVYAFIITLVFACIIAVFMRPKLAHVNMVESLKSVD